MPDKLPTIEEYKAAKKLVREHKICDWCSKLFKKSDTIQTIYYGSIKHWCKECYKGIKDDDDFSR